MSFNPLKEKGMQLEDQIRTWHEIAGKPLNKTMTNCYTRARQLLLNSIETGARNFKHMFSQFCKDPEAKKLIADIRRIEDMQQTTVNWLTPSDQSVLETTLAYEQTAVDLTAGIAQNEPDSYVKQAFDFCLLEDFDHLYRYSQWAYIMHNVKPSDITQCQTDIVVGRPTQQQHNVNSMRIRKPYDRKKAAIQTKVNIRTILALEHQTQNFYSEHGMYYGNGVLRETYAEICDVEEEHVTMYGSLIDSKESLYEKLLLQEFTEVCAYYSCMEDEKDESVRARLYEEYLRAGAQPLYERLQRIDPDDAAKIHPNNVKRLLRALEIAEISGKTKSECSERIPNPAYDIGLFIIDPPREQLYKNIDARVDKMFEDGIVNEVKKLISDGVEWSAQSMQAIGYKEFKPYFEGSASLEDVKEAIKHNTRKYAKRQITWFKRYTFGTRYSTNELDKMLNDIKIFAERKTI